MVAKITMPRTLIAALQYNENKLRQGKADCLYAAGYLREPCQMDLHQKLHGLQRLDCLNERATTKTIHISLNFHPSENLRPDRLITIAIEYMQGIGFGEQPFLIYRHTDAGHPHLHILSTTIRENGTRINTHHIGRYQSEKTRKEIEEKFGLLKAEDQKRLSGEKLEPVCIKRLDYGKTETKKSIEAVVTAVLRTYRYSSLPQFNAALKQFNVLADRGGQQGSIYRNHGLVYRMLDTEGNKIGVPIKASALKNKPTLDRLEKFYVKNQSLKQLFKNDLKIKIDEVLSLKPGSRKELTGSLQAKNVYTVFGPNNEGPLYGITFVDNDTKVVFEGTEIGSHLNPVYLQTLLTSHKKNRSSNKHAGPANLSIKEPGYSHEVTGNQLLHHQKTSEVLNALLCTQQQQEPVSFPILKKKRKRKRLATGL